MNEKEENTFKKTGEQQVGILDIPRSGCYVKLTSYSEYILLLMKQLDEIDTESLGIWQSNDSGYFRKRQSGSPDQSKTCTVFDAAYGH